MVAATRQAPTGGEMTDPDPSSTTRTETAGQGELAPHAEEAPAPTQAPTPPPVETGWEPPRQPGRDPSRTASVILGLVLLAVGLWFFAEHTLGLDLPTIRWSQAWPVFLIVIGGWILFGSMRRGSG